VSYSDQGKFSFSMWPFALKLLWAPLIDSVHIKFIGKRKGWYVLCSLLTGILMISTSNFVDDLLDENRAKQTSGLNLFIKSVYYHIYNQ